MIRWGVELKVSGRMDEFARRLSVPVQIIGQHMAAQIRDRVLGRGMDAQGGRLPRKGRLRSSTGRAQDRTARWWVPPEQPQPPGFFQRVAGGQWDGWAVYESYDRYIDALPPIERQRIGKRTGDTWDTLAVRVMGRNRVKVSFYGTRPTSKNARTRVAYAQIATLAARGLRSSFLAYTEEERRSAQALAQEMLRGSLRGAVLGSAATPTRAQLRGIGAAIRR